MTKPRRDPCDPRAVLSRHFRGVCAHNFQKTVPTARVDFVCVFCTGPAALGVSILYCDVWSDACLLCLALYELGYDFYRRDFPEKEWTADEDCRTRALLHGLREYTRLLGGNAPPTTRANDEPQATPIEHLDEPVV